ncbi:hypothetical protein [Stenotrophomonas phage SOVA965]
MVSPTPIITKPPPTRPASVDVPVETTVAPQGVHSWRTVIKQYSTWVLLFVMALPEAFQIAVSYGIVNVSGGDDPISKAAQLVAAVGLALKFVKQQKPAA